MIVDYVLVDVRRPFSQGLLREKSELVGRVLELPDYLYLCGEGEGDLVDGAVHLEFVLGVQKDVGGQGGADVVVIEYVDHADNSGKADSRLNVFLLRFLGCKLKF